MNIIKEQLADILAWWPTLKDEADHAGDPHAPTGNTTRGGDVGTPVERAAGLRADLAAIQARLARLAWETHTARYGEDATLVAGLSRRHPALVLHELAGWLETSALWVPAGREIDAIHSQMQRLVGYGPDYADTACPSCIAEGRPAPRLQRHPDTAGLPDLYACPSCGYVALIERAGEWNGGEAVNTARVTQRLRVLEALEHSDEWVRPVEAARLCGVSASTVRTWKQRGAIDTSGDGLVPVAQVAARARNNK